MFPTDSVLDTSCFQKITYPSEDVTPNSVTFQKNIQYPIHRWYPYKEGFSQPFVEKMFKRYRIGKHSRILDPFAGSGTIIVEAKKRRIYSSGFELNPFIHFLAQVKLKWDIEIELLRKIHKEITQKFDFLKFSPKKIKRFIQAQENCSIIPPNIQTLHKFYDVDTISRLLILKEYWYYQKDKAIRNILKLIFSSLLVDMSNASRSPSLGYKKTKFKKEKRVWEEFVLRLGYVIQDLQWIQNNFLVNDNGYNLFLDDNRTSKKLERERFTHLITSPPYINNIDYIRNTKLELFWCDFVKSSKEFYELKKKFSRSFLGSIKENKLLEVSPEITNLALKVREAKPFNKKIPAMITAYFSDMKCTFSNIMSQLEQNAKLAIVIGDSCFSGVHIPTDLIFCQILESLGYNVHEIEIVRFRRSTFHKTRLRECILHLEV